MANMKILSLVFAFAVAQAQQYKDIYPTDFLKDCEHRPPIPYIHDKTHESFEEINIFKTNLWNVQAKDSSGVIYLTSLFKTDVHGMVKAIFNR